MALFRADLTDASLARVEGDHMVIDIWLDGEGAAAGARRSSGQCVSPVRRWVGATW